MEPELEVDKLVDKTIDTHQGNPGTLPPSREIAEQFTMNLILEALECLSLRERARALEKKIKRS